MPFAPTKVKTPIILATFCALFAACDNSGTPPVVEKNTTIINPPGKEEKKVENNTTIVNPPAKEEKKTETATVTGTGASVEKKTTETTK